MVSAVLNTNDTQIPFCTECTRADDPEQYYIGVSREGVLRKRRLMMMMMMMIKCFRDRTEVVHFVYKILNYFSTID